MNCPAEKELIVVDTNDQILGYLPSVQCHSKQYSERGILHRAVSVFLFNTQSTILLQQRSKAKSLWPLYWSNACCTHPHRGESYAHAAARALRNELGLSAPLTELFTFRYQARDQERGVEHEMCRVFIAFVSSNPIINLDEIAAWRYLDQQTLSNELSAHPQSFTPWFRLEWARIKENYLNVVNKLQGTRA